MKRILPAYPLMVKDPFFSIWAKTEKLNDENVIFWTGDEKNVYGVLKINGKPYSILGKTDGMAKAEQTALNVTAFSTDYEFTAGGAKLKLSFVSPLPPDDLDLLSCPVCYVKYSVTGADDAELVFAFKQNICYNDKEEDILLREVRGGVMDLAGFETAFFGLKRQLPLSITDDAVCADWGYFYISGEKTYYADETAYNALLKSGEEPGLPGGGDKYIISVSKSTSGTVMFAYDDTVSINYFGDWLRGWYLEKHTINDALEYTFSQISNIDAKLAEFQAKMQAEAAIYGEEYVNILNAALRQSVGAHKLVRSKQGEPLFLSKECCSNGCIATVDVSYPSMPLYLKYNTELLKGMMRPIFEFANMPVWTYDFAPHDAGTYPYCCGQVYGLNDKKDRCTGGLFKDAFLQTHYNIYTLPANADAFCFENQMPVEECANMLVMITACYKADGDITFVREHFADLSKWVKYLINNGLKPDNQLCTDDFAGHIKNNINLAVKAVVGIACYAELCIALNDNEEAARCRRVAESYAVEIKAFAAKYSHIPLTWDLGEETYSLKYNFAFDKILGLGLFNQELFENEVDYYISRALEYGTPLDTRKEYTKSDWLLWSACLSDDLEKRRAIIKKIDNFLKTSPDRLPFSDWYEAGTGEIHQFRNRTVQGGCFILLLNKPKIN